MTTARPNVSKRKRRWRQFTLRTLMVFTALVAIGCGWFASKLHEARQQRQAVVAILKLGGSQLISYDNGAFNSESRLERLASVFDLDFLHNVVAVILPDNIADADFANCGKLLYLQSLEVKSKHITDVGLKSLDGLTRLSALNLAGTDVMGTGLQRHLTSGFESGSVVFTGGNGNADSGQFPLVADQGGCFRIFGTLQFERAWHA